MAVSAGNLALALPRWIKIWLQITSFVCIFDGCFIIFRPHTFPDGSLGFLFSPYKIYYQIDRLYSDMKDSFVYAQAVANLLEVIVNITCLYLNYQIIKTPGFEEAITVSKKTKLLTLIVQTMTFWKTVVYFIVYFNMDFRKDNSYLQEFIFIFCLNGIWIIVPLLCMSELFRDLVGGRKSSIQHQNFSPIVKARQFDLRESTLKQRKD